MRLIGLILLFAVALVLSLLFVTPLTRLQPWFPEIVRNGERFTGTVSRGAVYDLNTVNGMVDADWVLRPSALLRAALGADVDFVWDDAIEGEARVEVGVNRVVRVRDVLVAGPASQLDKVVLPGILRFDGDLRLDIREGAVAEGQYGPVEGTVEWKQATITGQIAVSFGDLTLTLREQDGETHGDIRNNGGDVSLSGTVVLNPDGAYQTDIVAVPAPSAERGVVFTLETLGSPESGNRFRIRESGNLTDLR